MNSKVSDSMTAKALFLHVIRSSSEEPVMAVEFSGSKVTNMNIADSKIGYKQMFSDGSTLQYSSN